MSARCCTESIQAPVCLPNKINFNQHLKSQDIIHRRFLVGIGTGEGEQKSETSELYEIFSSLRHGALESDTKENMMWMWMC